MVGKVFCSFLLLYFIVQSIGTITALQCFRTGSTHGLLGYERRRWAVTRDPIRIKIKKIKQICKNIEHIGGRSKNEFIHNLETALRIHASLFRSIGNFAEARQIRDRNAEKINGPIHRTNKESKWTGDADLLKFNEIMRDELDNTAGLIDLLEKNGTNELCLANDAAYEDCFLLGPDIIAQLKKKNKIMINHWRDIEDYMTTPFK